MPREPRDGGADVGAVFQAGFSGNFPHPYLTLDDLIALSDRCLAEDRVICTIEAFEIDGEHDVLRLEHSYAERAGQKEKPWSERARDAHGFISSLAEHIRAEINPIMFVVWIDRLR